MAAEWEEKWTAWQYDLAALLIGRVFVPAATGDHTDMQIVLHLF